MLHLLENEFRHYTYFQRRLHYGPLFFLNQPWLQEHILNIFPSFPSLRPSQPLLPQPMDQWTWILAGKCVSTMACWFLVNQGQRSKILENKPFLVIGLQSGYIEGQGGGQMGYYWQHANYFWQLAKCCRTVVNLLQDTLTLLAHCRCWWQAAKFEKTPRPRDARCTSPCMLHTIQSANPPHGQLASFLF